MGLTTQFPSRLGIALYILYMYTSMCIPDDLFPWTFENKSCMFLVTGMSDLESKTPRDIKEV